MVHFEALDTVWALEAEAEVEVVVEAEVEEGVVQGGVVVVVEEVGMLRTATKTATNLKTTKHRSKHRGIIQRQRASRLQDSLQVLRRAHSTTAPAAHLAFQSLHRFPRI